MKTSMKILPLLMGIMLFFTQCEKEADLDRPVNTEAIMNLKNNSDCSVTQTLWAGAGQNNTANGTDVGTVTASVFTENGIDYLRVVYAVDAPWLLTETHLWVGKKKSDIPRQAAPGRFPFKANLDFESGWTQDVNLESMGIYPGDPIYVAAHGVVVDGIDGVEGLEFILPETLSFRANTGSPDFYLSLEVTNGEILNGQQGGWCLDPEIILFPNRLYDGVEVFSSYNVPEEHPLMDEIDYFGNLELVNWIINFIIVGDDYTYTEVQQAIWELLFDDVNVAGFALNPAPRPEKVTEIKNLAELNGPGFVPECEQKVAIVLYKSGTQPIVLEYPVPCGGGSETAWAFGEDTFIDLRIARKWGWIFEINCY